MKKILLFVLVIFSTFFLIAQQKVGTMTFTKLTHDFGNISQDAGLAVIKFEFTNTGGKPINIGEVKSSCGCTTPSWSNQPIAPGKKGYVEAAYDPKNRPGHFSKTITVNSDAVNSPITLTISGNVGEKQNSIDEIYPQKIGELKLDQIFLNYGNIFNTDEKVMELKIYNPTKKDLTLSIGDKDKPTYTLVEIEPKTLKPEQSGVIKVTYKASEVKEWDNVKGMIFLTINGQKIIDSRIQISATIKEIFTAQQLVNPPEITFETTTFDFDTLQEGQSIDYIFKYTNTGKSDLLIRKTSTSCGCTAVNMSKDPVAPGKTGEIKITFNSNGKPNKQVKTVTVITNCPNEKMNKITLKISGFVIPKSK